MQSDSAGAETYLNIASVCLGRHARSALADAEAMVFVAPDFSHRSFSYRELHDLSGRFAASLKRHGLRRGDRILIRLLNTYHFPVVFFGALRLGLIPVPTSPFLTAAELNYLIADSGAVTLVSDEKIFSPLGRALDLSSVKAVYLAGENITGPAIALEAELTATAAMAESHPTQANDPAYLVYTSGTTGYPKGVLHAHRAVIGRLPAATHWFDFALHERVLHSGKFNWTYVLGTGMMDPLYHGKTVVVFEGESSPQVWIELIRRFACTTFIGVPTIFRQILQKTLASGADVPSLRHAMCAGEYLSEAVLTGWTRRFGFPVYEGLGMSECSYYISQRKGEVLKPNSAGKIQPGHTVKLLDENLNEVARHSEGMLCIHRSDPGLFLRYWNAEPESGPQFKDDWFLTGDYAILDDEDYVFFMGRRDDIIKSFGYRISPFEIERVFRDHEAIEDVVAFGEVLDAEKTLIVLCVRLKPTFPFDAQQILDWGKERLASYKVPKKVYLLDAFPRSMNGKIVRSKIAGAIADAAPKPTY